jgi:hypothetical protein
MEKEALTEYENRANIINGLAKRLAEVDITSDTQWVIQLVPSTVEVMRGGPDLGPIMVYNMFQTLGNLFAHTVSDDELLRMMDAFSMGHAEMCSTIDARMSASSSDYFKDKKEVKGHEREQGNSNSRTTH